MLHKYSLGYKRCFSASRERDISLEIVYLTDALFKHFNPFEGWNGVLKHPTLSMHNPYSILFTFPVADSES